MVNVSGVNTFTTVASENVLSIIMYTFLDMDKVLGFIT